jgi:hypothetical protein
MTSAIRVRAPTDRLLLHYLDTVEVRSSSLLVPTIPFISGQPKSFTTYITSTGADFPSPAS